MEAKLEQHRPRLVIFTFKETAKKLFGSLSGNGFVSGLQLAHSDVFMMPGPCESASHREQDAQRARCLPPVGGTVPAPAFG
jgi:alkylated DNA repair dioxygenase AlkB